MDGVKVAALARRAQRARDVAVALRHERLVEQSRLMERRVEHEEAVFWDTRRDEPGAAARQLSDRSS